MNGTSCFSFVDVPPPPVEAHQNLVEFGALWNFVADRPHARVLEIGSLYGGTLWYWSHLPVLKLLVSVDLPTERPDLAPLVRDARTGWTDWMLGRLEFVEFQADSHEPKVVEQVGRLGPFDFVFIDGDHSYQGVRDDWLAYRELIVPGGVVAFHDTVPNGDRHEPGVVRFVDELRHELPSVEWTDPDGVGIRAFTLP